MTFDSTLAWKEATAAIAANREVFYALAGVFFLLPTLAFGLLHPQPSPGAGQSPEQALQMMQAFYVEAMPWLVPMMLVQAAGSLAILALLTDHRRPTVAQAIRLGGLGLLPYLLAQLLVGLGAGFAAVALVGAGAAIGGVGLGVAAGALAVAGVVYAMVKTSLAAPVIMVEGERNPLAALRRSWRLTAGNSARIAVFYLLVGIAFVIISMLVGLVFGIAGALLGGSEAARAVEVAVTSALGSVMTLYTMGIVAAVHRQLAGPGPAAISDTFG